MYAITGVGIVDQLGTELDKNFERMIKGDVSYDIDWDTVNEYLIEKELFKKRDIIRNFVSPDALLGVYATSKALEDSGVKHVPTVPVITASLHGGGVAQDRIFEKYHERAMNNPELDYHDMSTKPIRWSPNQLLSTGIEFTASYVAMSFGYIGPIFNVASTCSSTIQAIEIASLWLERGEPYVIVTSSDALAKNKPSVNFFTGIGAASKEGVCKPFDENRSGMVLGDAAVTFILEKEEVARKRKAKIYGIIKGYGNANDASSPASPSPEGIGCEYAYEQAFKMAGISYDDIDFINAHGTATLIGDPVEIDVMKKYFDRTEVPIVSHKGNVGHCMGACGAVEIAYGLETLRKKVIPPTGGLEKPIDDHFLFGNHNFSIEFPEVKTFVKNSFGFGGRASAIIINKV